MDGYTEMTFGGDIDVAVMSQLGHKFFCCQLVG